MNWLSRIGRWLGLSVDPVPSMSPSVPVKRSNQSRMYAMGRPDRLTSSWGNSTSSEDAESATSLLRARNRSRELVRDASYPLRAKRIIQNNVVGGGIGLQARVMTTRNELNPRVNDQIETEWELWSGADSCHMGASLHFSDLERLAIGEVFEAGEVFLRLHYTRRGESQVPLAIEVIEAELLADNYEPSAVAPGASVRLGIEVDRFYAPIAYWFRSVHPGDVRFSQAQTDRIERVPASEVLHLKMIDRWPQMRGFPWMHAAARKFNDMDGLTEAEITAARGAACYMGFIESTGPGVDESFANEEEQDDGSDPQMQLDPAMVARLKPGQKFNFASPNRPNQQLDPFMRMMLREVAAGVGVSYESLSRDYSQSNYSSSRLALLDDRDLWRVLQGWFVRNLRQRLHRIWLRQAIFSKVITSIPTEAYALDVRRFEAAQFKTRGWGWIDPTKEVEAYKAAVRAGFTTVGAVIAATGEGRDLEDILRDRREELDEMEAQDLSFETDPEEFSSKGDHVDAGSGASPAGGDQGAGQGGDQTGDQGSEDNAPLRAMRGGRRSLA